MLPSRFTILRNARAIARWKVTEALHIPKGMRRHSNNPSSQAKVVFCRSTFRTGICQKPMLDLYWCRFLLCRACQGSRQSEAKDMRP